MVLRNWIKVACFILPISLLACISEGTAGTEKPTQTDPKKTEQLYKIKCGICHGKNGKLMIGGASDLTITELNKAEIVALITYGKGTMPAQKEVLSKDQIESLAEYVITHLKQEN